MTNRSQQIFNPNPKTKRNNAFALIGLLVVIVIIMILYFLDFSAIFKPARNPAPKNPESRPWLQEHLLVMDDNKIIELPEPPKPVLTEPITIEAAVTKDNENRGTVFLDFDIHGKVNGTWKPSFVQDDRQIAFDSEFAGNIDTEKTYLNNNKEEPSFLYFFNKGKYTQTISSTSTQKTSTNEGTIYVTGYLRPDYSAFGWITITTDKTWSAVYDFKTSQ